MIQGWSRGRGAKRESNTGFGPGPGGQRENDTGSGPGANERII